MIFLLCFLDWYLEVDMQYRYIHWQYNSKAENFSFNVSQQLVKCKICNITEVEISEKVSDLAFQPQTR